MEPKVIFEDDSILVIDKPPGMTVNRADTTVGEHTVQDWVEEYLRIQSTKHEIRSKSKIQNSNDQNSFELGALRERNSNFEFLSRAGIVHRLDKETSGVLVVAKTPKAFQELQRQFKEREVKKTYVALVHGLVKPEEGEIRVPVGRLPWNRKRFGIVAEGRESSTQYKVLANYTLPFDSAKEQNATFLELHPKTGRTHQIRVHLKYAGYPIVSDSLYGGRKQARNDRKMLPRLFLHAEAISFAHPQTAKTLSFDIQIPSDLQTFLNLCKQVS